MYYMLECGNPPGAFKALVEFRDPDRRRRWNAGRRFEVPPDVPLKARVMMRKNSVLVELWQVPLPLMTIRLHRALVAAGVDNLDVYPAELSDSSSGATCRDYVAFNLIGAIAAADLSGSRYSMPDGPMISVDFDSVAIAESKTRGALMFRLAECVSGIVVHESVKRAIEDAGIDTLSFIDPNNWAG